MVDCSSFGFTALDCRGMLLGCLCYCCTCNGSFESFLALAEPHIVILPKANDGDGLVYEVEAGRELNLACFSDITANLEISRFENGSFNTISGKTKLLLFLNNIVL